MGINKSVLKRRLFSDKNIGAANIIHTLKFIYSCNFNNLAKLGCP